MYGNARAGSGERRSANAAVSGWWHAIPALAMARTEVDADCALIGGTTFDIFASIEGVTAGSAGAGPWRPAVPLTNGARAPACRVLNAPGSIDDGKGI